MHLATSKNSMPMMSFLAMTVAVILSGLVSGQGTYGEAPSSDNMFWAASCNKGSDNWEPIQPYSDNTVGVMMLGQNSPAQDMPMFAAWIGAFVQEGTVLVLGYDAFPIYENSPPSDWTNFGQRWNTPSHLDSALDYLREAPQYLHIDPAHMWEQVGGDPTILSAWINQGTPTPPVGSGTNGVGLHELFPPGPLWDWALQKAQGRIDPKGPPGAGALTGINLVMQLGVLNGNGANGTPKINLSNALALTVTPGPPLMINMNGGNHGDGNGGLFFQCANLSPLTQVGFQSQTGAPLTTPIQVLSGSTFAVRIPTGATTGALTFSHPAVPTPLTTSGSTHFVRRFGPLTNMNIAPILNWGSTAFGSQVVQGLAFQGTATSNGLSINVPPTLLTTVGDITMEFYTYDPLTGLAGREFAGQTFGSLFSVMSGPSGPGPSTVTATPIGGGTQGVQVIQPIAIGGSYTVMVSSVSLTLASVPFMATARFTP